MAERQGVVAYTRLGTCERSREAEWHFILVLGRYGIWNYPDIRQDRFWGRMPLSSTFKAEDNVRQLV